MASVVSVVSVESKGVRVLRCGAVVLVVLLSWWCRGAERGFPWCRGVRAAAGVPGTCPGFRPGHVIRMRRTGDGRRIRSPHPDGMPYGTTTERRQP
ncbi:hypothetical protein GCM10010371_57860 [Streptomyces subrutilus]|uniref:Uncharacterized protein n=1 Tax=Streptomyces subrutilus TaxID=36818 RepID=A0A918RB30_9ACTN|nr:hypothetical protein GCM10010371_57860 [Streptomyces subrutilus]